MDKKYVGGTVVLPTETNELLEQVRSQLATTFGFRPSKSQAIAYLTRYWQESQNGDKPNA